jgi:hypothetical protein
LAPGIAEARGLPQHMKAPRSATSRAMSTT